MNMQAFFTVSYGMYIVSSKEDDKINGQLVNTVMQVTAEPPRFAICINKENLTKRYIDKSRIFTISTLEQETSMKLIGTFGFRSGRELNKFEKVKYKIGKTGAPIVLDNAISYFECEVEHHFDADTHVVYIGKVIEAEILKEGEPLTYDYYYKVKNGLTSKAAPTYIKKEEKKTKEESKMKKYVCTVCGYIYDPEKGDPDSGAAPGTSFEDLPDDWKCPACGVGKDMFEPEE